MNERDSTREMNVQRDERKIQKPLEEQIGADSVVRLRHSRHADISPKIKMTTSSSRLAIAFALTTANFANAQPCSQNLRSYPQVGLLANRSAGEITHSSWSVGAETMDRNYTVYNSWKSYLGPLGVKFARMQAGWAQCEPFPNRVYNWDWLDGPIADMVSQGVTPWLQTSFGNLVYPGGGTNEVSSPLPSSAIALAAWGSWVKALVSRYQDRVSVWEIWNEPNIQHINSTAYANFTALTAGIIKSVQPTATVRFAVVAGVDVQYAINVSRWLQEAGAGALVDVVTYHPYVYNPDSSYEGIAALIAGVQSFLPHVTVAQGENGAPSVGGGYGALGAYNWTECSQAKYFSRRLVHDGALGIPSSAFSIVDLCYLEDGKVDENHKGLLEADCNAVGYPVLHPKLAYSAVRHVTSVFDEALGPLTSVYPAAQLTFNWTVTGRTSLSEWDLGLFAWAATDGSGRLVFSAWNVSGTPLDAAQIETTFLDVTITITGMSSAGARAASRCGQAAPTYAGVDMMNGAVFSLPAPTYTSACDKLTLNYDQLQDTSAEDFTGVSLTFTDVPVLDYPVLIADLTMLHVVPVIVGAGATE